MKKNKKRVFACLAGLIFCLVSCEKIIEPKNLPEQDPRLVLNFILYNNSEISVSVSSSKSILSGKDYKFIKNANCSLYEDGVYVEQLLYDTLGNYTGATVPKLNKTYTVKVSASGFKDVEGSTSLGNDISVDRIERYDSVASTYRTYTYSTGYITGTTKFKMWINDDPKIRNYYTVTASVLFYDQDKNLIDDATGNTTTWLQNNANGDNYNSSSIETDDLILVDGNRVAFDFSIGFNVGAVSQIPRIYYVGVYIEVSNMSEDLYKYKYTLNEQAYTGPSLFAEPVQVYNNIKNGMGIAGSLNTNVFFARLVPVTH